MGENDEVKKSDEENSQQENSTDGTLGDVAADAIELISTFFDD